MSKTLVAELLMMRSKDYAASEKTGGVGPAALHKVRLQKVRRVTMAAMARACQVLGVTPKTPLREAKKKYRATVAVHHPDVAGGEALFKDVRGAYETLRQHRAAPTTLLIETITVSATSCHSLSFYGCHLR